MKTKGVCGRVALFWFLSWGASFARIRRRKVPPQRLRNSQPTQSSFSVDRPLLPWDAAVAVTADEAVDLDASNLTMQASTDAWTSAANEAAAQQTMLGPAVPLPSSCEAVSDVLEQGVAIVKGALSPELCQRLRNFVLEELPAARRAVEAEPSRKYLLFSRDIRETRSSRAASDTRFELQLPRTAITESALLEALRGPVGDTLETLAGDASASLWEFTAMASCSDERSVAGLVCFVHDLVMGMSTLHCTEVAMPGAIAQRLHCDTGSPSPALFTAFVALQDVDENMGPTRFLLRSNSETSHQYFSADKTSFLNKAVSRIALLRTGDAVVYDGRVLHSGTNNYSDKPRVLLVLTVRHIRDSSVDQATQRTQRAYARTKVLADFRKAGALLQEQSYLSQF